MNLNYIPNLTAPSGQVLTTLNWQMIGVDIAACDLTALLIKPGIETLKALKNLKAYWQWHGKLLLNTDLPIDKKTGGFVVRSPFDGRTLRLTTDEVETLTKQLAPDTMPKNETYHINNKPSEDALQGIIYADKTNFSIQDKNNIYDFSRLSENCRCSACKRGLTRAYFHHLYEQTPLLCHRFLIMHNQWMTHHTH